MPPMPAEDIVLLPTLLTETGMMHHVPCATHPIAGVQEESKADQGEFALCQEGKCTHPWQPARLIKWNNVWVGQNGASGQASSDIPEDLLPGRPRQELPGQSLIKF